MRLVFVGEQLLTAECADKARSSGHTIVAIVTNDPRVAQRAQELSIRNLPLDGQTASELAKLNFDHLLSVANLHVLSPEILAQVAGRAINFHDGPLPTYAGLNTPAWAIFNGEPSHGITWHEMTASVDAGPIIARTSFPIDPDETAFSLNSKCFEAALNSFGEVLHKLALNEVGEAQSGRFTHYFTRADRPADGGILDFESGPKLLDRLGRALDWGHAANPLGLPTLLNNGQVVFARSLRAEPNASPHAAGTVLACDDEHVEIACRGGIATLRDFVDESGHALSPSDALRKLDLSPGVALARHRPDPAEMRQAAQSERFWATDLSNACPVTLPLFQPSADVSARILRLARKLSRPCSPGALAALVAAYIQDVVEPAPVTVWVHARDGAASQASLVEAMVPLNFSPPTAGERVADRVRHGESAYARACRRGGYLKHLLPRLKLPPTGAGDHPKIAIGMSAAGNQGVAIAIDTQQGEVIVEAPESSVRSDMLQSFVVDFAAFLNRALLDQSVAIDTVPAISPETKAQIEGWNGTQVPHNPATVAELIELQVARTPDATAIVAADASLTYRDMDQLANALAARLADSGVQPGSLVGVLLGRTSELPVTLLAVHKLGAAYLPLDPRFPPARLAYMLQDSRAPYVVAAPAFQHLLGQSDITIISPENLVPCDAPPEGLNDPASLAYVMYTSGSTGNPKGVMVEHRNLSNFFIAMDRVLEPSGEDPGTWLAVTSLSFDISVLELLWTLARGFKVVLAPDEGSRAVLARSSVSGPQLSLFFFASEHSGAYDLLLQASRFADANHFEAVWTPERHFHDFGGAFPNPAVTAAALATATSRIRIRAGSVVLPLHSPVRVAEDWALVDNLSNGRVGVSFAAGWQPRDFVINPSSFGNRKESFLDAISLVQQLWRGDSVTMPGPDGEPIPVGTLPRPLQKELPTWVTSAGNPETFRSAGRIGARILTHLLGQDEKRLAESIRIYKEEFAAAGHPPARGGVTLMLHTFVAREPGEAERAALDPLKRYLASSVDLVKAAASQFPTFKPDSSADAAFSALDAGDRDALLEHSARKYIANGLIGTVSECVERIRRLSAIGVTEFAALIDFGIPGDQVLASLELLNEVRSEVVASDRSAFAELLADHGVSHLQCTPSFAALLLSDDAVCHELGRLKYMLVGGEALPAGTANRLRGVLSGDLLNMYGPTETTIWSTHDLIADEQITIGRPFANTTLHIVSPKGKEVPIGFPGELFIGGEGVVHGYLGRPELTHERFVDWPTAGNRVYRTGDIARWCPDGRVEFLGRADNQVKIRGHRIELGEIEATLSRHPEVDEAVVVERNGLLIGYLTRKGTSPLTEASIRAELATVLPSHMVPARVVILHQLPKTPNGKIDRKALSNPTSATDGFETPAPPLQTSRQLDTVDEDAKNAIGAIWAELLGKGVGDSDNFFESGGDSLLIVKLHSKLTERFGPDLKLIDLFQHPTVSGMAAAILRSRASHPVHNDPSNARSRASARRQAYAGRR